VLIAGFTVAKRLESFKFPNVRPCRDASPITRITFSCESLQKPLVPERTAGVRGSSKMHTLIASEPLELRGTEGSKDGRDRRSDKEIHVARQAGRQVKDRQTDRQTDKTDKKDRKRQTVRQTGRQVTGKTDKTDRQTDRN
jgi:hypothetical protein